ncbi:hypothetical protein B0H66DRAFT_306043 [Apodospora peruviana]|uniref:Uncharacterized protein n=1 Tax=Apodospora peruviana TaxID=516989 RepID=A0AAE0M2F4_9PEZI|nr:hypothetical protein B0H66DRAFT_306043 [Apodospora peruviana]
MKRRNEKLRGISQMSSGESEETEPGASGSPKLPESLIMVNQLWLWEIGPSTFMTGFPYRCCSTHGTKPSLLTHLCQDLGQRRPKSMRSMITRLLQQTVDFVDSPNHAGLDENLFDIFDRCIADQAQNEMHCYSIFYEVKKNQKTTSQNATGETAKILNENRVRDEEHMCDITKEIEHLREVKDIRDELKMIERVFDDQLFVLEQYCHGFGTVGVVPEDEYYQLDVLKQSLYFRLPNCDGSIKTPSPSKFPLTTCWTSSRRRETSTRRGTVAVWPIRQTVGHRTARRRINFCLFLPWLLLSIHLYLSYPPSWQSPVETSRAPKRAATSDGHGGRSLQPLWSPKFLTFLAIAAFWLGAAPRRAPHSSSQDMGVVSGLTTPWWEKRWEKRWAKRFGGPGDWKTIDEKEYDSVTVVTTSGGRDEENWDGKG